MSETDPTTERPEVNWTEQLALQLSWHWENQLRKRLEGLSDDEYFWEPVDGSWSVCPRGVAGPTKRVGSGQYTIDFAYPTPDPAPVTTIAWRLGHLLVGVFGARNASHFGASPVGYDSFDYPGSADAAPAEPRPALPRLDRRRSIAVAGRIGRSVRRTGFRSRSDGRVGAAHPPRSHPSLRRDLPVADLYAHR